MKIYLEKFICDFKNLIQTTRFLDEEETERRIFHVLNLFIDNALLEQGLEYRDGVIVEVEQKKEPLTEFECGYKQAIEDAIRYMDKVWGLNIFGNSINDFRETMEQNLKEK